MYVMIFIIFFLLRMPVEYICLSMDRKYPSRHEENEYCMTTNTKYDQKTLFIIAVIIIIAQVRHTRPAVNEIICPK